MKKMILLIIALLAVSLSAQTIEETLAEIEALKKEIAANETLVEEKIAEMKGNNPLFADKNPFESDFDYIARMAKVKPQLDTLRQQYLGDLKQKLNYLEQRLFETKEIDAFSVHLKPAVDSLLKEPMDPSIPGHTRCPKGELL